MPYLSLSYRYDFQVLHAVPDFYFDPAGRFAIGAITFVPTFAASVSAISKKRSIYEKTRHDAITMIPLEYESF